MRFQATNLSAFVFLRSLVFARALDYCSSDPACSQGSRGVLYTSQADESKMATTPVDSRLKVAVLLGTIREGRMAQRVASFIQQQLASKYDLRMIDPLELDLPMIRKPLWDYADKNEAPKVILDLETKLREADAFLVVTAEYNHSIPPALANLIDYFEPNTVFGFKPSGIVSYSMGIFGGMRAAIQLRAMLSTMGTMSVANILGIPAVHEALDETGTPPEGSKLHKGLEQLMTELDWYARAMKSHRDQCGPPKL